MLLLLFCARIRTTYRVMIAITIIMTAIMALARAEVGSSYFQIVIISTEFVCKYSCVCMYACNFIKSCCDVNNECHSRQKLL